MSSFDSSINLEYILQQKPLISFIKTESKMCVNYMNNASSEAEVLPKIP